MSLRLISLATIPLALAAPARAQVGVDFDFAVPAVEQLETMCSPAGIFQYPFGAHDVPHSSRIENTMGMRFVLPERFAPFTDAAPHSTPWSGQLFGVEYEADFVDQASFDRLVAELDEMLPGLGWEVSDEIDFGDLPIYQMGYRGGVGWHRTEQTEDGELLYLLDLDHFAGKITLACARDDLLLRNGEEAFGDLPPGTPRPQPPELPFTPVPTVEACLSPEFAPELDAFLEGDGPGNYTGTILAQSEYQGQLSTWLMWRLEQAGMPPEEGMEMVFAAIGMGGGAQGLEASLGRFMEIFPIVEGLGEAQEAGDRTAACENFVQLTGLYTFLAENAAAQTAELERRANARARELGISLDE